jgi:hypothetical protein
MDGGDHIKPVAQRGFLPVGNNKADWETDPARLLSGWPHYNTTSADPRFHCPGTAWSDSILSSSCSLLLCRNLPHCAMQILFTRLHVTARRVQILASQNSGYLGQLCAEVAVDRIACASLRVGQTLKSVTLKRNQGVTDLNLLGYAA